MRIPRGHVLLLGVVAAAMLLPSTRVAPPVAPPVARALDPRVAAAVTWPASGSLVISEIETGGTSASDEFIEIANVGPVVADLAGFEIAAASSVGTTASRRIGWSVSTPIEPGRHFLVANAAGAWAAIADGTYTTGLAATGGAVVLRPVGGTPVDGVGWGDAANPFVEGAPAPAPPAGASIERRPGGEAGNGTDTNDNAADLVVRAIPAPQGLADPPTPAASPAPGITPSPAPTAADPTPSSSPTPAPSAPPSATASPSPAPTLPPTAPPTPGPTPSPASTPTPTPTPSPSPTPTPSAIPIADARRLPDGAAAIVEGILTTDLGDLDADHTGFVQDGSGGIALYLDVAAPHVLTAGTLVRVAGSVDTRYGLTVLRCVLERIEPIRTVALPQAVRIATGAADSRYEGVRVTVSGTVADAPSSVADGVALEVDDGSGPVRVIVDAAVAGAVAPVRGTAVVASGPLGRRDSGGTTTFRIHATLPGSLTLAPAPDPTPSALPSATPTPTISPSPAPTASPSPSAAPTSVPTASPDAPPAPSTDPVIAIASALTSPPGRRVRIHGVVTSAPGLLWSARLGTVQDTTGAVIVRYRGDDRTPTVGARIDVTGTLLRSGNRLVLRADEPWSASAAGLDQLPEPVAADAGDAIGQATDARLAFVAGTVAKGTVRHAGGRLSFDLVTADGARFGVSATQAAAIPAAPAAGIAVRVTGIGVPGGTGMRTAAGRVWLRTAADLVALGLPASGADGTGPDASGGSAANGSTATNGSTAALAAIASIQVGETVTVSGVVSVGPGILAPKGRGFRIEDASGSVEILAPAGSIAPAAGRRVSVSGRVERLARGPRIRAAAIVDTGSGTIPVMTLAAGLRLADVGHVVRVAGTVARVERPGTSWRAAIAGGSWSVLVAATAASGPAPARLVVGARVTVTGLVMAAPAGAADARPRIVPRGPGDIVVSRPAAVGAAAAVSSSDGTDGSGGGTPGGLASGPSAADPAATAASSAPDVPLRTAGDLVAAAPGVVVRVSGIVRSASSSAILLQDLSGVVRIRLAGAAAPLAASVRPGDALSAVGTTDRRADGSAEVTVDDPSAVTMLAGVAPDSGAQAGAMGDRDALERPEERPGDARRTDPTDRDAALLALLDVSAGSAGEASAQGRTSAGPPDPGGDLPFGAGALAGVIALGALAAGVAVRRFRPRRLDSAVARRLAALGSQRSPEAGAPGRLRTARPGARPAFRLDARLTAGLSSPPTRAGKARPR